MADHNSESQLSWILKSVNMYMLCPYPFSAEWDLSLCLYSAHWPKLAGFSKRHRNFYFAWISVCWRNNGDKNVPTTGSLNWWLGTFAYYFGARELDWNCINRESLVLDKLMKNQTCKMFYDTTRISSNMSAIFINSSQNVRFYIKIPSYSFYYTLFINPSIQDLQRQRFLVLLRLTPDDFNRHLEASTSIKVDNLTTKNNLTILKLCCTDVSLPIQH